MPPARRLEGGATQRTAPMGGRWGQSLCRSLCSTAAPGCESRAMFGPRLWQLTLY